MTLKYENSKEFSGIYGKTTMLIFSDKSLNKNDYINLKIVLSPYKGHSGESIEIKIFYDDIEYKNMISLIIICFNTLLVDVSKKEYSQFIKMHEERFMKYYNRQFKKLLN
jgi:hypothetical protein